MSVWLGGIPYSNVGALQVRPRSAGGIAATYPRIGPQAVDPTMEAVFIEDGGTAVPANARNVGGFCYTDDGALYVTADTSTGPFSYIRGQKVRQDGAVCIISRTPTPATDPYIGGAAFDAATGAQIVSNFSFAFMASFPDAGAGAVRTNLLFGTGSATFTRATTATTVNSAGLVVSVGTGVARSYYDPTTLAYLGYLAEGARTNICLQSEDFATTWSNNASSETINAAVAPDGNTTADKIVEDGTNAEHGMLQSIVVVSATVYSFSIFAKAGERPRIALYEASTTGAQATFDLSAGTVVGTAGGGSPSATIKAYPNGWYRCTLIMTAGASAGQSFTTRVLRAVDAGVTAYLGDGVSGLFQWGAQLEAGSFPSSYIPTTTVSVTRNADVLTYPSAGNVLGTAGTAYAEISLEGEAGALQSAIGGTTPIYLYNNGATPTNIQIFDGTATTAKSAGNLITSVQKAASSWGTGKSVTSAGAVPGTGAFDGDMNIGAAIEIGSSGGGSFQLFGTIKNIMISQSQLTDAQLQALTA